jgi:hypothetical protein
MLHLFEPLGVGVGPSFLWAHTCMECWMYLNVFQIHIYAWNVECIWMCFRIHIYAWNVECIWMCFEYTHMHGMLFECNWMCFEYTHMHGMLFECVWTHTYICTEYGLNAFEYTHMHGMLLECVWTHTYGRNMVWMCLNIHILLGILFLSSHWPSSFSSILLSHCEEVLVKSLA